MVFRLGGFRAWDYVSEAVGLGGAHGHSGTKGRGTSALGSHSVASSCLGRADSVECDGGTAHMARANDGVA
jgi:hypothetical protein